MAVAAHDQTTPKQEACCSSLWPQRRVCTRNCVTVMYRMHRCKFVGVAQPGAAGNERCEPVVTGSKIPIRAGPQSFIAQVLSDGGRAQAIACRCPRQYCAMPVPCLHFDCLGAADELHDERCALMRTASRSGGP